MLEKITVERFRLISGRVSLMPPQITLFMGGNNTGKTTYLEAIKLLCPVNLLSHLRSNRDSGRHDALGHVFCLDVENPYYNRGVLSVQVQGRRYETVISRLGRYIRIEFMRDDQLVCSLLLDDVISRVKYDWSGRSLDRIDGRTLRHLIDSDYASDNLQKLAEIMPLSKKITYYQSSKDDPSLIHEFEIGLVDRLPGNPNEFIERICTFFAIPKIDHLQTRFTNKTFIPEERVLRQDRLTIEEINGTIELLRQHSQKIGRRKWLSRIIDDAKRARDAIDPDIPSKTVTGYGGLQLAGGRQPAHLLGSGVRSILNLCLQIELNEVILIDEPETFLHHTLQRKLAQYIRERAAEGKQFFISSHSEVFLNHLFGTPETGIIETYNESGRPQARSITGKPGAAGILDSLGIRASHILQANCVIWLEGPSDRILVNRWIELWSGGVLREGEHYSCLFYGGSLLRHFGAGRDAIDRKSAIDVLIINRNAIFLADSDKPSHDFPISMAKARMMKEVTDSNGVAFLTHGRTIENYIPLRLLIELGVDPTEKDDRFLNIRDSIGAMRSEGGPRMTKVELAHWVGEHLELTDLLNDEPMAMLASAMGAKIWTCNYAEDEVAPFDKMSATVAWQPAPFWSQAELKEDETIAKPLVIKVSGDDQLSRLGRTNDLILIKNVRSACESFSHIGLRESLDIVRALRLLEFDLSDEMIRAAIASVRLAAPSNLIVAVRQGILSGIAELTIRFPLGDRAI